MDALCALNELVEIPAFKILTSREIEEAARAAAEDSEQDSDSRGGGGDGVSASPEDEALDARALDCRSPLAGVRPATETPEAAKVRASIQRLKAEVWEGAIEVAPTRGKPLVFRRSSRGNMILLRGLFRSACYLKIWSDRARFAASPAGRISAGVDAYLRSTRRLARHRRELPPPPPPPPPQNAREAAATVVQRFCRSTTRRAARRLARALWDRVRRRAVQRAARSRATSARKAVAAASLVQRWWRFVLRVGRAERIRETRAWEIRVEDRAATERLRAGALVVSAATTRVATPRPLLDAGSPVIDVLRTCARRPLVWYAPTVRNVFEHMCSRGHHLLTEDAIPEVRRRRRAASSERRRLAARRHHPTRRRRQPPEDDSLLLYSSAGEELVGALPSTNARPSIEEDILVQEEEEEDHLMRPRRPTTKTTKKKHSHHHHRQVATAR